MSASPQQPTKILFVCLGNICRSPTAEGIFASLITQSNLTASYHLDSAGTIGIHQGKKADPRMRETAHFRGYDLTSRSRQITIADLTDFDHILVMDEENRHDVLALTTTNAERNKITLMTDYCTLPHFQDLPGVPDPYYGGAQGFQTVIDILEDSCSNLLTQLQKSSS